jgi:hypothetical protein
MSNTPGLKLEDLQYADNEPTDEEIQKRAYELYLDKRDEFSSREYWLAAEEELRRRADQFHKPIPPQNKTI